MRITSLYRYPVKGLSPERLPSVRVASGEGFPLDRIYALLRTDAAFHPAAPTWLAKANFVMLMLHEQIAGLKTHYSEHDKTLHIQTPDGRAMAFLLDITSGRTALEQFMLEFIPKRRNGPLRLVEAQGHQFTDKAAKYISLINLASLRELERRWGQSLDPLRFRANVYIEDAEPFSELDWVGREVLLGNVHTVAMQRNGRCAATNVNPDTGIRDRDIPGQLRATFGHKDLGIYLRVINGGWLREGDPITVQSTEAMPKPADTATGNATGIAAGQLICTACYYLFDPRILHTAWSRPEDLPDSWRCPDCGATRDTVIPAATQQAASS